MSEIKWIKLYTNIFDNRKIKQIETLPEGDAILVIWLKLLVLAGNINDNGLVYFTRDIPYTDEMLASQFNKPLATIKLALNVFTSYSMVEIVDNVLYITNWEKYQNIEGMEKVREQNRLRQKKWYDNQKMLTNVTPNVSLTQPNATDKNKNKIKNKIKINKDISAPSYDNSNAVGKLATNKTDEYYYLHQEDIDKYKEYYPAVDVEQEIKNMSAWLDANPKNRKTHNGMPRFINGWLSREQNRTRAYSEKPKEKKGIDFFYE